MTIESLANKAQSAVKLGDALGKTKQEIHADVIAALGDAPLADAKAVHAHIAQSVIDDEL